MILAWFGLGSARTEGLSGELLKRGLLVIETSEQEIKTLTQGSYSFKTSVIVLAIANKDFSTTSF
jgi:hypothetical protein